MQTIVLENRSSKLSDADLDTYIQAWSFQLNEQLRWGWPDLPQFQLLSGTVTRGVWGVVFQDGIPIKTDMGYHDKETGSPIAYVDVAGTLADGYTVSEVGSHELCEMAVDPDVTNYVTGPWGTALAETCDPFIMPWMTYKIEAIEVANFTTRKFWGLGECDRLDMKGMLNPSQVFPYLPDGGYAMVQPPGGVWGLRPAAFLTHAVTNAQADAARRRAATSARCQAVLGR
jgi:hypothetical protein